MCWRRGAELGDVRRGSEAADYPRSLWPGVTSKWRKVHRTNSARTRTNRASWRHRRCSKSGRRRVRQPGRGRRAGSRSACWAAVRTSWTGWSPTRGARRLPCQQGGDLGAGRRRQTAGASGDPQPAAWVGSAEDESFGVFERGEHATQFGGEPGADLQPWPTSVGAVGVGEASDEYAFPRRHRCGRASRRGRRRSRWSWASARGRAGAVGPAGRAGPGERRRFRAHVGSAEGEDVVHDLDDRFREVGVQWS